jgi:hypothetical protein
MKNSVLFSDESACGNCVRTLGQTFLAESSDKGPSTQHLRPNFQPTYQQHGKVMREKETALFINDAASQAA